MFWLSRWHFRNSLGSWRVPIAGAIPSAILEESTPWIFTLERTISPVNHFANGKHRDCRPIQSSRKHRFGAFPCEPLSQYLLVAYSAQNVYPSAPRFWFPARVETRTWLNQLSLLNPESPSSRIAPIFAPSDGGCMNANSLSPAREISRCGSIAGAF